MWTWFETEAQGNSEMAYWASNFKNGRAWTQGWLEISSMITCWIAQQEVQLLNIDHIYNKSQN